MKKIKLLLHEIFIEGLSGMATGLFATLIIGTIIQQIIILNMLKGQSRFRQGSCSWRSYPLRHVNRKNKNKR